ncbi:DUF2630 family protein [Nocardioides astragali]|uniref:DUF2630 family protein n=1 Tax=Nocardioides astragali TaxID=1776736 RepID=A0ABW2N8H4_9ACTN|nr:DUF2630 family protein [Nocardioides astragali]
MNPDQEKALLAQVAVLVARERDLRAHLASPGDTDRINERAALHQLEEELDQCWDLLRQRRALSAVHLDPDEAHVRPVAQVENYLPHPGAVQ